MKNSLIVAIGLLVTIGCGGNDAEQQAEAEQQANALAAQLGAALEQGASMAAEQAQQAAQAAQPAAAAGESNFGTVTLNPGFVPDPHTESGTSGGSTDATSFGGGCNGYISGTPDHLMVATGAFSSLRVMAHSTADVTLVMQKPDGTYLCDDDHEGTDPLVEGAMPAGTYKIWIGSYEQGTNSAYTLGFSELSSVNPSSLGN